MVVAKAQASCTNGRVDVGRPRTQWVRIGVMLHETSEMRPLLGLKASADGGIILSPGDSVPAEEWEYGIARIPGGRYIGRMAGEIEKDTVVRCSTAPKLHYHRSGWVSADLTGRLPKRSVRCLPLSRLRGAQFFTYSVTNPKKVPISPLKTGDTFVVSHARWPADVTVFGFLYAYDQIPNLRAQLSDSSAATIVQHRKAWYLIDLAGHGIEAVLALRFGLNSLPRDESGRANAWLYGFDTFAVLEDTIGKAIGMWTVADYPRRILLCPPAERPFAGAAPLVVGQPDISWVHRRVGGGVISQRPVGANRDRPPLDGP